MIYKVIPIQTDREGLVIEHLEEKLKLYPPQILIYYSHIFKNPTGKLSSQARREKLVSLAREHDFFVIADEIYHLLNYRL